MLILGARGFAKEVLETVYETKEETAFYDDINEDAGEQLFGKFKVLKNIEQAKNHFKRNGAKYCIGIGNPLLRYKLFQKFNSIGGVCTTTISKNAIISSYNTLIREGCNILANAIVSNSASIGKACLLYYNVIITHDCLVGDFVELSPGATLLGRCKIGDFTHIGANATILPDIQIGKNVIIGAGAVVNKNIPDNSVAVGVPAYVIRQNEIKN